MTRIEGDGTLEDWSSWCADCWRPLESHWCDPSRGERLDRRERLRRTWKLLVLLLLVGFELYIVWAFMTAVWYQVTRT